MSLTLSRILHAGYLFKTPLAQIAFDPIFETPFSRNCYAFPPVTFDTHKIQNLALDAVFISHYHDDHFSLTSLNLLDKKTPIYMYSVHKEPFDLLKALGFSNVHSLKLNTSIKIKDIMITPWPALDYDVDSIFQIQINKLNILNVVDSWIDPETRNKLISQPAWDLILWPFQTLRELEMIAPDRLSPHAPPEIPEEWLEDLKHLNPKQIIPSSCQFIHEEWSWYNRVMFPISYNFFKKEIKQVLPLTQVIRLDPSQSFDVLKNSFVSPLDWVQLLNPPHTLDYDFKPHETIPTTSQVARHFPALTSTQRERVLNFCEKDLLGKFVASEDPYFLSERVWRLNLYDHLGEVLTFTYAIKDKKLIRHDPTAQPDWVTEVPITKLYMALEQGESLTSMYVRVVGSQFEDILEDPLISSVFRGCVDSYQREELKRIKK